MSKKDRGWALIIVSILIGLFLHSFLLADLVAPILLIIGGVTVRQENGKSVKEYQAAKQKEKE